MGVSRGARTPGDTPPFPRACSWGPMPRVHVLCVVAAPGTLLRCRCGPQAPAGSGNGGAARRVTGTALGGPELVGGTANPFPSSIRPRGHGERLPHVPKAHRFPVERGDAPRSKEKDSHEDGFAASAQRALYTPLKELLPSQRPVHDQQTFKCRVSTQSVTRQAHAEGPLCVPPSGVRPAPGAHC